MPKSKYWRYTAEIPKLGRVQAGSKVTEKGLEALKSAKLKVGTYTVEK